MMWLFGPLVGAFSLFASDDEEDGWGWLIWLYPLAFMAMIALLLWVAGISGYFRLLESVITAMWKFVGGAVSDIVKVFS